MNLLQFDSIGGASGDMVLAALLDLGADAAELRARLKQLPIESFELDIQQRTIDGQRGTQVTVKVADEPHPHRRLRDIRRIIEAADYPAELQAGALRVFERLAAAEASVHGTTPDQIHFHEVGAMDAIVDITGACIALTLLDVQAVSLAPLPVGRGATRCAHGVMPLPVPATAELLKGFTVTPTDEPYELITPTGAALLTTWSHAGAAPPSAPAEWVLTGTGVGLGHRKLNARPNLLRATLLRQSETAASSAATCCVLETNIDDTPPELIGSLTENLLQEGALDVFTTPVYMKRQRPATLLTTLCLPQDRARLRDMIFAETTTFGIREHTVSRTVLARRQEVVTTAYGPVRVKIGSHNGKVITRSPEHADCVRCAREHHVPVRAVYEAASRNA